MSPAEIIRNHESLKRAVAEHCDELDRLAGRGLAGPERAAWRKVGEIADRLRQVAGGEKP